MNEKLVALNYLKIRFWIDLCSTIPFNDIVAAFESEKHGITTSKKLKIIGLIKLSRLLRLGKMISFLNQTG